MSSAGVAGVLEDSRRQPGAFLLVQQHQVGPAAAGGDGGQHLVRRHLRPANVVQHDRRKHDAGVGLRMCGQHGLGQAERVQRVRVVVPDGQERRGLLPNPRQMLIQLQHPVGFNVDGGGDVVAEQVSGGLQLGHAPQHAGPGRPGQPVVSAGWKAGPVWLAGLGGAEGRQGA